VLKRGSVLLLAFIWLFASALQTSSARSAPVPRSIKLEIQGELNLLVQQFLLSKNEAQSKRLLQEILAHKDADITHLEQLIASGGLYPPEPPTGSLHHEIAVQGERMSYALYVPENYEPSRAYPLIICLHGAGFAGDSYLDRWAPRLGKDALLVCPTVGRWAWWSPMGEALVGAVLEEITAQYHIDENRIFLTGMSNGGIGVYLIGIFHADRFAAISPMASGIPEEIFAFLKNFSTTGIYIIHGKKDQVMPVRLSRDISRFLKKEGISHIYREHEREHPMAGGHFFPREELPALILWFQSQARLEDPARLISVRDKIHLGPFYWTEILETEGRVADVQSSLFDQEEVELVKEGAFASLEAEIDGNRVEVKGQRVKQYRLFFNNRLVDLSKPVSIIHNGQPVFSGKLSEDRAFLLEEAKRRGGRTAFYTASVTIDLAAQALE